MKKTIERLICDNCKKFVDQEEIQFGGSPFSGWFTLDRVIGGTSLANIQQRLEWPKHFCCKECLLSELEKNDEY